MDWQTQSSKMHSIYHDSTITLAALDAIDPSQGLFLPKHPFVDVFPLPQAFGDSSGQAYVSLPSWDEYTHSAGPYLDNHNYYLQQLQKIFSHFSYALSGILETRAWAMQELRLSQRVLYFFKGEMMWRCAESIWRQNGCRQSPHVMFHLKTTLERHEKAFNFVREMADKGFDLHRLSTHKRKFESSSDAEIDGESDENEDERDTVNKRKVHVTTASTESAELAESDEDVSVGESGWNRGQDEAHAEVGSELTKGVFDVVLAHSKGYNIQDTWYSIVSEYSNCQLTLAEDKLPALSGLASRFQAITKDEYIAGHWRINLEQSLFWTCIPGAFRVKLYRAPTWSWASIEGGLTAQDEYRPSDDPESLQVLNACVQVDGDNPFGRVTAGKLMVKASAMEAHWSSERRGWLSSGRPYLDGGNIDYELTILDYNGNAVGRWDYDDGLYGILPGSPLAADTSQVDIAARLVYVSPVNDMDAYRNPGRDLQSLWSKVTYIPEDLLLVKGPVIRKQAPDETGNDTIDVVAILVLKRTQGNEDEYERVGIGELAGWDDSIATVRTFAVV